MTQVSSFMIGLCFIGFFMAVFGLWMADANSTYGVTYDNDSIEIYNQLDEMSELSKDIEEGSEIEEKSGVLDIIGGYFTDAYNVLKLTKTSFNVFDTMSNKAIDDANLGAAGEHLRVTISAALLILIVLGVIIAAILKWYV